MHDILLKYEMLSKRFVKFLLTKNLEGFVVKHHGYRRTDAEIIKSANKYGFKLLNQENYAFVHEFRRSSFFNKVVKQNSMVEKILSIIGQTIPYIRMGNFKKVI